MYRHAAGQSIFALCSMLLVLAPGLRPHAAAGGSAGAMGVVGVGVVEDPSRIPMISAGDVARLQEHIGQRVIVVGVVKSAQWSASGKVMNIEFTEGEGQGLLAVVFENRARRPAGAPFWAAVRVRGPERRPQPDRRQRRV